MRTISLCKAPKVI